jgi:NAD(P)-dependent dehydrogenase (short-subunit alcohol dehydrogenase family)
MELDGRIALVTGGGSGIGRATVHRLAAEGMAVCVVDRDPVAAGVVADAVGGIAVVADVGVASEVDTAFAECAARLGGPDLAVANAGIAIGVADLADLADADYRRILGPNVDGVVFTARAAIRAMRARGGGVIVATASLAGLMAFAPDPVYALTKHAVVGLVRSIAPGLADDGIAVHAVCPGLTDTAILGPEIREALDAAGFPLMDPAQIAEAVVTAAQAPAEATGSCWVCQPGRPATPYGFRRVPGPRVEGAVGQVPDLSERTDLAGP